MYPEIHVCGSIYFSTKLDRGLIIQVVNASHDFDRAFDR